MTLPRLGLYIIVVAVLFARARGLPLAADRGTRPRRALWTAKRFPAIAHDARRARRYTFELSSEDLSFINADNKRVFEPGLFDVQIGGLKQTFEWK